MVEYSCGTRADTTGCINERVGILGKSSYYCRMCYRNQPGNLKSNEKKKKCNFQLWVAQYARILFLVYAGTKYMTNTAIMIQHIYYCVKYQLYDQLPDFLPVGQSNVISWPKYESRGWDEF